LEFDQPIAGFGRELANLEFARTIATFRRAMESGTVRGGLVDWSKIFPLGYLKSRGAKTNCGISEEKGPASDNPMLLASLNQAP